MQNYKGIKVFGGFAFANLKVIATNRRQNKTRKFSSEAEEFARFNLARTKELTALDDLYVKTLNSVGKARAAIFETHKLMVQDLDFEEFVKRYISEENIAEVAVEKAGKELSENFSKLDDEYMKARAADVIEISTSIINILNKADKDLELKEPTILICNDLDSSLLMKFDRKNIAGLILANGNVTSHVSILARSLQIPSICCVSNLKVGNDIDGKKAILNAIDGTVAIDPTPAAIKSYKTDSKAYWDKQNELKKFLNKPTVTKNGQKLKLFANIAGSSEVSDILKNGAEGVGLFRSEFIYLNSKTYPTEDEQFGFYKQALEDMKGKEVIIRTFDIGADKKVPYFDLPKEDNPALGYRSIRICVNRPDMFKTQLRALLRASVYGNLSIMIPMIISKAEIIFTKELIEQCKNDLRIQGIPFKKDIKIGIMIETPAAAIVSDELAKYVDFFSIGTNDLSQYTLACDRLNSTLIKTFNPHHIAILRLIKLTVENAHKAGITVGMCGELARDKELLPFWIGLGFDELSCSSSYILELRKSISEIDSSKIDVEKFIQYPSSKRRAKK